ncbi:CoA transferase subunit A [Saccharopolyspora rhizosphaerae]|uniref:CoA transferase subunit A n=1 Tax=Saccharopolyspora rhizosphaerae TaxID=2492662 RepID=A0A3R8VGB6_9PSEU|nr:CoA-transferase [Saccharopolyspora rhizosphaerae]RRO16930.1 CoA transferase subunit A [Saccharopolyspora rhizosphaerae]
MPSADKVTDMASAVAAHVEDGMTVALEGFGHLIPFAAGHEIIRQAITGLTFCRMTPDLLADQMIAAGCVRRLVASFFASGSAGSLHEVRRRVEHADPAPLEVEEYSHYGMVCRYQAGASGVPFLPLRSYAGSDLPRLNPMIRKVADPYGGPDIYVVPALRPDVTIVHAQRADRSGNVQMWGITGAQQEAAYAARTVIATVEEVVDEDVVRSDPNRTVLPSHAVAAVVECPGGAHPSYSQGHYDRDNAFYREWTPISRDRDALLRWLDEWVHQVPDRQAYLEKLGAERWETVRVAPRPSQPVDFGRRQVIA